MSVMAILGQLTPAVVLALSRMVASDQTLIGIPRNVRVHLDPSGRIFEMFDRKLEEVEWLPSPIFNVVEGLK
jgi:hypothetical protein